MLFQQTERKTQIEDASLGPRKHISYLELVSRHFYDASGECERDWEPRTEEREMK